MYRVYIKVNESGYITAINSSAFMSDTTDWVEINSGNGDRFRHAQGNYLNKPIKDGLGRYNFKYVNDVVSEVPEADKPEVEPSNSPSAEERLTELEAAFSLLLEGATE